MAGEAVEGEAARAAEGIIAKAARDVLRDAEGPAAHAAEDDAAAAALRAGEDTAEQLVKPAVTNTKLQNIVNNLFKGVGNPARVGNGTTADAIRHEIATGLRTAGRRYVQKGEESVNGLNNLIVRGVLSPEDAAVAHSLLADLIDALKGGPGAPTIG